MVDINTIAKLVADGVVYERQHSTLPLRLYNYAPRCQYEKLWCETSLQCRGLIVNDGQIVARPFRKFFNDGEHQAGEIPWHLPCEVTEKMDGSLLILYHFAGQWNAATRGSFDSEQTAKGADIFKRLYGDVALSPGVTYLFEVIYPGNRIVLDYGMREDVVLLGMIEAESGNELPLECAPAGLTVVRRLPPDAPIRELRTIIRDNEEGYVVRFANGFRIKVKGERYMQLHRIISHISSRMVWEHLSAGTSFDEVLNVVPDEFAQWVIREQADLQKQFDTIAAKANAAVFNCRDMPTRKEQAIHIRTLFPDVAAVAFAMLDKKEVRPTIWKMLYPPYRVPERLEAMET